MIASVDGAASLQGRSGALGGPADKSLFALLRALADVIVVGTATTRTEGYRPARLEEAVRARRSKWGLSPVPPIAVVTQGCRLDWTSPFFTEAEQRPLVLTAASAGAAERARAAQVADVIVAGERPMSTWARPWLSSASGVTRTSSQKVVPVSLSSCGRRDSSTRCV